MKKTIAVILTITSILSLTACQKAEEKVTIKEPGKTITIIDDNKQEEIIPAISVEKIDQYEKLSITDWLDENTVVISKENESLDKISLAELSDSYPRSLYLFDITTKEYKLLKEQEEVFLDGATLSSDNKYLLYSEYSLGDPAFYVMNMDTLKSFGIMDDTIGGGSSAKWGDEDMVIGAAYGGGAYIADRDGKITVVDGLEEEALYLVEKIGNKIYYNTQYDGTLMRLDMNTKEKVSLDLGQVFGLLPSPDGKQILIIQADGSKDKLLVYDLESEEKIVVAEGTELNGVSWSPDQRRIAYKVKDGNGNTTTGSLYIYDTLTGAATQIAVNIESIMTSWSPSGDKLAYTEYNGTQINSSVIHLK